MQMQEFLNVQPTGIISVEEDPYKNSVPIWTFSPNLPCTMRIHTSI